MIAKGTIVTIYEDPLTMTRKEGNATVIEHVCELEDGVDQYKVNFIGDDLSLVVVRTIAAHPMCVCHEKQGDNSDCRVHGMAEVSHAG